MEKGLGDTMEGEQRAPSWGSGSYVIIPFWLLDPRRPRELCQNSSNIDFRSNIERYPPVDHGAIRILLYDLDNVRSAHEYSEWP
jgi:hypothetical protein